MSSNNADNNEPLYRSVRVSTGLYRDLGDYCYSRNANLSKTLEECIESFLETHGWYAPEDEGGLA